MKALWYKIRTFKLITLISVLLLSCLEDTFEPAEFGSIDGRVIESTNGDALIGVEIKTSPASNVSFSDSVGNFNFSQIPVGEYTFTASLNGYEKTFVNANVSLNLTTEVVIRMNRISTIPGIAFDPIPSSGMDEISRDITLSWSSGTLVEDSATFNVLVYESNIDTAVFQKLNSTDTFISLQNLKYETTYFWQVTVISSTGDETKGELWNFTTIDFPDNRFLFVKNENGVYQIYSAPGDSMENMIRINENTFNSLSPLFSRNRKEIAYSANSNIDYQIYIMDFNGKNPKQITDLPLDGFHSDGNEFCWWPDNGGILYSHYDKLYSIDRNGSNLRLISTANPGRHFGDCDFTDVTNKIVVQTIGNMPYQGEIYLMNSNGSDTMRIVDDLPGIIQNPSFSVDGKKIMYTRDASGFQSANGRQLDARIYILDLDSMETTDISLNKSAGTNDLRPRFSPFGSEIIFTNVLNDGTGEVKIFTMDIDGTNRKMLFQNADMPDWN